MTLRAPWVLLLAAAVAAQHDLGARVQAGLERARPELLRQLDGQHGGELALLCLAALHDGVPASEPVFARALDRMVRAKFEGTYELALRLMVLEEAAWLPDRAALAKRDCEELLRHQCQSGGFWYRRNPKSWDLSNTQYAALGLRAAVALGCKVPVHAWRRLCDEVLDAQGSEGGFGYSGESRPTASMTVAGIAVLEICRWHLKLSPKGEKEIAQALADAWTWVGGHGGEIGGGRGAGSWAYYFLYGLERAAILSDRSEVGGVDWYATGAGRLLREQNGDGGWGGGPRSTEAEPVSTAFAVLFLRRKFQRQLGAVTQAGGWLAAGLPEQATDEQVRQAAETETRRGTSAVPDLLKTLRSPLLPRRRAAALALTALCGQDFGYHPARDEAANADALKRAELWWLAEGSRRPARRD